MIILLAILMLVAPSLADAAYNTATFLSEETLAEGSTQLRFRFTGNADEKIVDRVFAVGPSSTVPNLRHWIGGVLDELNNSRAAKALMNLTPGQVVPRLAKPADVPSAKDVWQRKVADYAQFCTQSFTGAIATDCTTLKSDIETTYQAGFLDAQ